MINIITSFFQSRIQHPNIELRNREIAFSLHQNLTLGLVEKVHLFVDDDQSLDVLNSLFSGFINDGRLVVIGGGARNRQPTYKDMFDYAIHNLDGKLCMVTNSDIFIEKTEERILQLLFDGIYDVYALTRHEVDGSRGLIDDYHGSHDSFIFVSSNRLVSGEMAFNQNVWGSEAKLLSILYTQGMKIKNPCKQIKIVHVHSSGVRNPDRVWIAHHTHDNPSVHHPPVVL
jgi:hypothetical protein